MGTAAAHSWLGTDGQGDGVGGIAATEGTDEAEPVLEQSGAQLQLLLALRDHAALGGEHRKAIAQTRLQTLAGEIELGLGCHLGVAACDSTCDGLSDAGSGV